MDGLGAVEFVIIAIAAWRLAFLVTREDAPFQIALRFRTRFPLGGLTHCIYCASVWTAALCYALWYTPLAPAVVIVAVSGAALMLASYTGANHS